MTDMSPFQHYVFLSKYSRFIEGEGRRETWPETVERYFRFFDIHLESYGSPMKKSEREELRAAVEGMRVMPSMRCLMTAGKALERDNIAGYNCAYLACDRPQAFSETLFVLMCGTGVGFSVERQYVQRLPEVPDELHPSDTTIVVADSKIGWAKALAELVSMLYGGNVPRWDMSKVRPAGAVLKTFGGRASGPEPLERLFRFVVETFKEARGRRLTSLECHDLLCMVGDCVVVGGVRRSALISLSNLSDDRMRSAKSGQWWTLTPHRSLANNSAVYDDDKPEMGIFMSEWKALFDSKSGERGIFSRAAARNVIERSNEFRSKIKGTRERSLDHVFGCNPCSEILLRPDEFCNLTEAVIRPDDDLLTLTEKVRQAAILGTLQSTLTDFRFIRRSWRNNTEDERLLGVSLTGIMDHPVMNGSQGKKELREWLFSLRTTAIETNVAWAKRLGIDPSVAVTCVKPSGTVSSLVDAAAGIHARHSPYYLRTVRSDKKDPVGQMMAAQGLYHEDDVMRPDSTSVFTFPVKAPETARFRGDVSALDQLDLWMEYQLHWCDHKPSVTVSVGDREWMSVGAWVYENFEWMSGVSFLPRSDHSYQQAPYQEVDEKTYEEWVSKTPTIDFSRLSEHEKQDETTASQEMACQSGGCDI